MRLEQSFEVAAPLERVWEALVDVQRVAPCLPGASITERNDDGSYSGAFTIKIGPTTASYTGKLEMEMIDENNRTATMRAQGSDKRGQGGAKATIVSKLTPTGDGGTRVEVDTDYSITGRLARFGRGGMIEDISERLLREFASRLQASLVQEPAGEPEPARVPDEPAPLAPDGAAAESDGDGGPPAEGAVDAPEAAEAPEAPEAPEAAETPEALAPEPVDSPEPPEPPEAPAGSDRIPHAAPPLPTPEPAPPLEGLSLVGGVMVDRAKRNPAPLVVAVALLLLLLRRRRRRRRL